MREGANSDKERYAESLIYGPLPKEKAREIIDSCRHNSRSFYLKVFAFPIILSLFAYCASRSPTLALAKEKLEEQIVKPICHSIEYVVGKFNSGWK
ncbi:hypothetical protein J4217_01390 [Candidatus Pacearchaeota archaeon]|nr:hypothetical protein [Candidatus Pacearchaeota archaeon]